MSDSAVIGELALKSAGSIALAKKLPKDERAAFLIGCLQYHKKPAQVFLYSFSLGFLGLDRFMIGDTALGIGKLLTLGGCGVW